jgi:hypothetical protein
VLLIRLAIVKEYGLRKPVRIKEMTSNWVTAKSPVPQNPFLDSAYVQEVEEVATPSHLFLSRKPLGTRARNFSDLLET